MIRFFTLVFFLFTFPILAQLPPEKGLPKGDSVWHKIDDQWIIYQIHNWTYTQDSGIETVTTEKPNGYKEKDTYTYKPNGDFSTLTTEKWTNGGWEGLRRYFYFYDTISNKINVVNQELWQNG